MPLLRVLRIVIFCCCAAFSEARRRRRERNAMVRSSTVDAKDRDVPTTIK